MTCAPDAQLIELWRSPKKGVTMERARSVELVAGQGLVGDRRFSLSTPPRSQVTLIESEALAAAMALVKEARGVDVEPSARRNLVTRGVALNHLIGRAFFVGEALVRGVELCEPCGHLAKLTSGAFERALVHRGGLRCEILTSATVVEGDAIRIADVDADKSSLRT
jgi:MOSC domain-containing protein YiiM